MSYIVAVLLQPVPSDDAMAWAVVNQIIEQEGPRPQVFQELHDLLTAHYPCMCAVPDDQIDDTVWSDGPLINNFGHQAAVLVTMDETVDDFFWRNWRRVSSKSAQYSLGVASIS
jgi:hypothetical protein